MKKMLELKNVSLTYHTLTDEIEAVKNLSFNCTEGEFLSIIGPSGCGKSTILSMIAGLIPPTSGSIIIDENKKPSCDNLGYMLQKDQLFSWRTIEKNVYLPLEIKKIFNQENKDFANQLLEKYGLKGGIVRNDDKSDELCICMDNYSDDIQSDDWAILSDVL